MKKLEVKDLKENFFEAIGKEWLLPAPKRNSIQ